MPPEGSHDDIKRELRKNSELLREHGRILKKLHRYHIISAWSKVVWFVLIIGLPFALYFYILEPYFAAFGSSYETFQAGINELPGLKGWEGFFNNTGE